MTENKVLPYGPNSYKSRIKALNCPWVCVWVCKGLFIWRSTRSTVEVRSWKSWSSCCSVITQQIERSSRCRSSILCEQDLHRWFLYHWIREHICSGMWKKTKGPLNLLCLNLADLHRCIFVCRRTWISSCFSREAELLGWKIVLFFSGGFRWLDIDFIPFEI